MKNEFTLAFNEVIEEKQLPKEIILKALESAMVSAYRRAVNASNAQHVEAKIDAETGRVLVYAEKEVVDSVVDPHTEVTLEEARKISPDVELGSLIIVESTPEDFGRVAAQTARQVIQQRIREAERQAQLDYFNKQLGEIANGVVQAVNAQGITIGMDMKAEGVLPRKETIPGERFRVHDRLRALIYEIKDSPRGPQIILSRAHRNFLRRLLETEVPEIYHGVVEIRSIAREPGQRAKVAVSATQQGIDPVGACVGIRGVRIQAIVRELHEEKIDVIEWNNDPAVYIAKAISPARVSGVYLNEHGASGKTATVVVPEDQLSLAIGRDGQNARLAAKLTNWRIDIKSLPEAASDALNKLHTDDAYKPIAEAEAALIPDIEALLQKKAEGRPLTPEEYDVITRFVDRVERRYASQRQEEKKVVDTARVAARQSIPDKAFDISLDDLGLPVNISNLLVDAGYPTIGDLALQMNLNSDEILGLQGMGPKSLEEIKSALARSIYIKQEEKAEEVVEAAEPAAETIEPAAAEEAPVQAVEVQPAIETAQAVETVAEEVKTGEPEVTPVEKAGEEQAEEEYTGTLDEIFALKPEVLKTDEAVSEEDEEGSDKKGKKHKKKHVEIVYDPDRDLMMVKKKHKRGDGEWGDWE
jgi:N utilization substance protein A